MISTLRLSHLAIVLLLFLLPVRGQQLIQPDSVRIEFVGDANLQSVISNESKNNTTGGLGIIFYRQIPIGGSENRPFFKDFLIEGSINVASTLDTIDLLIGRNGLPPTGPDKVTNLSDVGTFILQPSVTQQNAVASITAYFNDLDDDASWLLQIIHGVRLHLGGSNAGLTISNNGNGVRRELENLSLTVGYARIGVFHEFIPHEVRRSNDYSLKAGLDLSARWMFGDLGQRTLDQTRLELFGTDQRLFLGYEPSLKIQLKNLVAEASLPSLFPEGWLTDTPADFKGLTNSRLTTTIRFVGGFPLGMSKSK